MMQKCHRGKLTTASSLLRVGWVLVSIYTLTHKHTNSTYCTYICTRCFMHVHQLAGRRIVKHTSGRQSHFLCWEPISSCSVYSCMLIMMILNDEVSLNNDSQLKALNMAPCSRANTDMVAYFCFSSDAVI